MRDLAYPGTRAISRSTVTASVMKGSSALQYLNLHCVIRKRALSDRVQQCVCGCVRIQGPRTHLPELQGRLQQLLTSAGRGLRRDVLERVQRRGFVSFQIVRHNCYLKKLSGTVPGRRIERGKSPRCYAATGDSLSAVSSFVCAQPLKHMLDSFGYDGLERSAFDFAFD